MTTCVFSLGLTVACATDRPPADAGTGSTGCVDPDCVAGSGDSAGSTGRTSTSTAATTDATTSDQLSTTGGAADSTGGDASSAGASSDGGPDHDATNCEPDPESCGYPGPTTTGVPAGTPLTVHDGDLTIADAGTVIDGLDIHGCVRVTAPGVTIRNSRVSCDFAFAIFVVDDAAAEGAEPALIEDVEIACSHDDNVTGAAGANFTARRVLAHDCENGFSIDHDVTIEDSYVPGVVEVNGGHPDAVQVSFPAAGLVVRRNTLFAHDATAAVNWTEQTESMVVEDNLLAGGGYTVYCPRVDVPAGAFQVIDNRFGTYTYGHTDSCGGGDVTFAGNFSDADLAAIDPD